MDFVYIPPGTFVMGGERKAKEGDVLADTPRHEVTLTNGLYLGTTEVTQTQYLAITNTKRGQGPDHPVDAVKPFTALQICDDLSAKVGQEVRLPTEAEWEYAARESLVLPPPRIEGTQLSERCLGDHVVHSGHPFGVGVVHADDLAVGGEPKVALDSVGGEPLRGLMT